MRAAHRLGSLVRLAPLLLLVAVGSSACEDDADGPSAPRGTIDADVPRPIDAGLPDAARAEQHCDSVMYWCEAGHVYQGYINHATNQGCSPYPCSSCSASSPELWSSFEPIGDCASGCRSADAGPSCEYWDAIGGMVGSYPEDALAELCAP